MRQIFEIDSMVKIDQILIEISGRKSSPWSQTNEIYRISKILKISPDGYKVVELDRNLPKSNNIINTYYLRLLTKKETRKFKLEKIHNDTTEDM